MQDVTMSRFCLILMQTPLVAQDLSLMLKDLTGCTPITVGQIDEACSRLSELVPGSLLFAVVQSDAAGMRDSPLRCAIERLDARLVLTGHAAEMEAAKGQGNEAWPVLAQPFGPGQVAELLAGLRPLSRPRA